MSNYFNTLNFRNKLIQLSKCRFMNKKEFSNGINYLENKKIVIVGCGSQGLNQGLNIRDAGLDISYALRKKSIDSKNQSWLNAINNNFNVGYYEDLIPEADLVINLTPDKQHSEVVRYIQKLMKNGSYLGYSHGFNIVEVGEKIRNDITVIMVAPKSPGTEVREEYIRGFGVPTLIAVHPENDPKNNGINIAKSWAVAIGSDRAGVLESSFIAEVKSDLMGEQTILCGMLQTGSLLCFEKLIDDGVDADYATKFIQFGWETITESLKIGGITLMMDRLSNYAKIRAYYISEELKKIMTPLFHEHMDNIISGNFSYNMINDWKNNDKNLIFWREKTRNTMFEKCLNNYTGEISEQEYYDKGLIMVAMIKAGIELTFETMIHVGIAEESAYYESLHELPLIANTIARKRLYEMNLIISDTAEYGNYLFSSKAIPLLKKFIDSLIPGDLGKSYDNNIIHNEKLRDINELIRKHPIEVIGHKLRSYMINMKK
ncbi:ketol-acid reductoisomerase [Pantoea sp. SoEX]|uniref:ketol-acid reductoisomerase n=1 Tax=Pantoea sp. SoEX TaxID=2576763 RepID=UPI001358E17B|nr:ketol-acid reductoisomerase [Pantoea sp. SoEX]MXP51399.1 ketol-acid reductoisomerase [Pantoea sp. SoEX]